MCSRLWAGRAACPREVWSSRHWLWRTCTGKAYDAQRLRHERQARHLPNLHRLPVAAHDPQPACCCRFSRRKSTNMRRADSASVSRANVILVASFKKERLWRRSSGGACSKRAGSIWQSWETPPAQPTIPVRVCSPALLPRPATGTKTRFSHGCTHAEVAAVGPYTQREHQPRRAVGTASSAGAGARAQHVL